MWPQYGRYNTDKFSVATSQSLRGSLDTTEELEYIFTTDVYEKGMEKTVPSRTIAYGNMSCLPSKM